MTNTPVIRCRRTLARLLSRRSILVGASAVLGASVPRHTRAQRQAPTCGAEGEVCTHLAGCCAGLVCATSMINTTYGICIPGEGDVAAVTRALVTPGDADMVAALGEELVDREEEAVLAEELLDERTARIEERQERQRAKQQKQRARRRDHRAHVQARRRGRRDAVSVTTTSS
jgi:hypothetical protein